MPRMTIAELRAGTELQKTPFLLASLQQATDRNGTSYLKLTLRDRTGDIEARYWRVPSGVYERLSAGKGVAVSGEATEYRGVLQITVSHIFPFELEDMSQFLPIARRSLEAMIDELQRAIDKIKNPYLKRLLEKVLGEPEFQQRFFQAPAAKLYHHACVGGLLEHSLDVLRQVVFVAERYPELDKDLAATVALLHDVGKVDSYDLKGSFEFTDVGRLWGHLYAGAALVDRAIEHIPDFPNELRLRIVHAILSHHGRQEWGSPVTPRTPEAIALHYADNLDGNLRGWVDHVQREAQSDEPWTSRSGMHDVELYRGRTQGES